MSGSLGGSGSVGGSREDLPKPRGLAPLAPLGGKALAPLAPLGGGGKGLPPALGAPAPLKSSAGDIKEELRRAGLLTLPASGDSLSVHSSVEASSAASKLAGGAAGGSRLGGGRPIYDAEFSISNSMLEDAADDRNAKVWGGLIGDGCRTKACSFVYHKLLCSRRFLLQLLLALLQTQRSTASEVGDVDAMSHSLDLRRSLEVSQSMDMRERGISLTDKEGDLDIDMADIAEDIEFDDLDPPLPE